MRVSTQTIREDAAVGMHYLEKEMATHSSILVWEILWTEEPGRLQSMGSQNRHDLTLNSNVSLITEILLTFRHIC